MYLHEKQKNKKNKKLNAKKNNQVLKKKNKTEHP